MTRLLTTTACIAALSAPAIAGSDYTADVSTDTDTQLENAIEHTAETAQEKASNAMEYTEEQVSDAAEATENTAEVVAEETEDAVGTFAETVEEKANAAAEATSNAMSAVADTAKNAADATVNTAQDVAAAAEVKLDSAAREAAIVMDDSWDTEIAEFDAPFVEREGWAVTDANNFDHSDLAGMRVYGANDEWIGEIDNVVIDQNDNIVGAVLGVGGFIGIGEKDVLVSFNSLTVKEEVNGDDMRAYVDATEESLEELPAYPS